MGELGVFPKRKGMGPARYLSPAGETFYKNVLTGEVTWQESQVLMEDPWKIREHHGKIDGNSPFRAQPGKSMELALFS